jgi:hypothetical protein
VSFAAPTTMRDRSTTTGLPFTHVLLAAVAALAAVLVPGHAQVLMEVPVSWGDVSRAFARDPRR